MPKRTNPFQQLIAMVVELLENGSVVTESVEYRDPAANNLRESISPSSGGNSAVSRCGSGLNAPTSAESDSAVG
jgi:hypothetical protein